jgi:hypothetical protein
VKKTEGPKFVPMKQKVFKITVNGELSTKLFKKNSLPSTAHESQFSDKQKFHSAPKQGRPVITEVLSN